MEVRGHGFQVPLSGVNSQVTEHKELQVLRMILEEEQSLLFGQTQLETFIYLGDSPRMGLMKVRNTRIKN